MRIHVTADDIAACEPPIRGFVARGKYPTEVAIERETGRPCVSFLSSFIVGDMRYSYPASVFDRIQQWHQHGTMTPFEFEVNL